MLFILLAFLMFEEKYSSLAVLFLRTKNYCHFGILAFSNDCISNLLFAIYLDIHCCFIVFYEMDIIKNCMCSGAPQILEIIMIFFIILKLEYLEKRACYGFDKTVIKW